MSFKNESDGAPNVPSATLIPAESIVARTLPAPEIATCPGPPRYIPVVASLEKARDGAAAVPGLISTVLPNDATLFGLNESADCVDVVKFDGDDVLI